MNNLPGRMALLVILMLLTGCGTSKKNNHIKSTSVDTVIDAAGRTVIIPATIHRVISPFTMYTRLIVAMGGCSKLAGISHTCVLPEEERGCNGSLLNIPDVGQFGANMELIASLKPDLIFASQPDVATFSSKTDAAVVAVSFPDTIPMLEIFNRQIDIISTSLHLKNQGDSLKQFISNVLDPVVSVTAGFPDSIKPKVYFAWTTWTGDILNTVCNFDPIELAGGINVARDAKNFAKGQRGILVSREHIIKWNPDIIFISRYQPQSWHKNSPAKPLPLSIEDVLSDPLLQSISAIKNGRVYYTSAFCNWWPQQRAIVQVLHMAKLFYPELFTKLDVEMSGNSVYKRFYGVDSLYSGMIRDLELYSWN